MEFSNEYTPDLRVGVALMSSFVESSSTPLVNECERCPGAPVRLATRGLRPGSAREFREAFMNAALEVEILPLSASSAAAPEVEDELGFQTPPRPPPSPPLPVASFPCKSDYDTRRSDPSRSTVTGSRLKRARYAGSIITGFSLFNCEATIPDFSPTTNSSTSF